MTRPGSRLIAYVRVSSNEQASGGHSLETQEARIKAYCVAHQCVLTDVISDPGVSASTLEREGLEMALALIAEGRADGLVVTKLDRLTRSVVDLGKLIADGAGSTYQLHSLDDHLDTATATGRLMLNLIVSVSQWERERTGERTSEVLRHLQRHGKHLGHPPYGWRRYACGRCPSDAPKCAECGKLVVDAVEQAHITAARRLRAEGKSLETVAAELNAAGVVGRMGGAWTATAVKRCLARDSAQ